MSKQNVKVIKNDTVVKIEVSGAYYNRIYDLMMRLVEKEPDPKQALLNIEAVGKPLSISEAVIQSYMMLIKSVEDAANQNPKEHIQEVEVKVNQDPS
jgi:hypothetical protein